MNKLPLQKAEKWAKRVVEILAPHCERIEIAGSIRRKKSEIADIEIVCIPKRESDMFGAPAEICEGFTKAINQWKSVRGDADGRYTQRILPNTDGFTVDIFIADNDNWGWIFALRTGSAIYAQRILLSGLRKVDCFAENGYIYDYSNTLSPRKLSIAEESDLYKLMKIEYMAPEKRNLESW